MAPRKVALPLQDLSFLAVRRLVTTICNNALKCEQASLSSLTEDLGLLLQSNSPSPLHDKIADDLLLALKEFYKDYWSRAPHLLAKCREVVRLITTVLRFLQVKKLTTEMYHPCGDPFISVWTEVMHPILVPLLKDMSSLKELICDTNYDYDEFCPLVPEITKNVRFLSGLTSFDCQVVATDALIRAVCASCPSIQVIRVTGSDKVSDDSIRYLTRCKKLQIADVGTTCVSLSGLYDLFTKTKSETLFDIGSLSYPVKLILNEMRKHVRPFRTFPLKRLWLEYTIETKATFKLLVKYFPHLEELSLSECPLIESSTISKLKSLTQLVFQGLRENDEMYSRFFQARGTFLTSLSLFPGLFVSPDIISEIANTCPNIETLKLYGSVISQPEERLNEINCYETKSKPFQKLTNFIFYSNFNLSYVNFILGNASNIEYVRLDPHPQVVTDAFIESVLQMNPLKKLKKLEISSQCNRISAKMLKKIIVRLDQISSLSSFSYSPIVTKTELKRIRAFMVANNYDLILD